MYLFSDDLSQINAWQKSLSNFTSSCIDEVEQLLDLEDSFIICSAQAFDDIDKTIKKLSSKNNKILLLDNIPNFSKSQRFLKLGVQGYGNVMMSRPFLESAIMSINEGLVWLHPELMQNLIMNINEDNEIDDFLLENLTAKEKEVCLLLKDGLKNNDISQELNMSINTVKAHIKKIYEKLNVNDRLSLALLFKK